MLKVPLFTAEALLRHAEWSKDNLLDQWVKDPVRVCQLAGVQYPSSTPQFRHSSMSHHSGGGGGGDDGGRSRSSSRLKPKYGHLVPKIHSENSFIVDEELAEEGILCEICCDLMTPDPTDGEMQCTHRFCGRCWKNYLHTKIQEGQNHILCPAFECNVLVPNQVIERHVSPTMARR